MRSPGSGEEFHCQAIIFPCHQKVVEIPQMIHSQNLGAHLKMVVSKCELKGINIRYLKLPICSTNLGIVISQWSE